MALGKHHSGVMANDQSLADDLIVAGERAMDTAWQLPLDDEYDELLKSIVCPDILLTTSPGFDALCAGIFSTAGTTMVKLT
jgi:leucyl aminopeptidase